MKQFFLIAILFCSCKPAEKDFHNSEFDRGAKFVCEYYDYYHQYPSYADREKAFLNPDAVNDLPRYFGLVVINIDDVKMDTVYVHDTIYTSKNYKYVEKLVIGGDDDD